MRFGLDRMRRMMTALGSPERRFDAIHVLGTNGKSSTTRMTAAILERHGLRTGAYLSPHLVSYRERVRIGERELDADELRRRRSRARRWAAERVNRTLAEDDHVTQFELLTAAAFWQMAERGRRGGGRRGRARRALRRHQRDRRARHGAHQRRPRAHPLARADAATTSPRRSSRRVRDGATLVLGEDLAPAGARGRRAGGGRAGRADRARRAHPERRSRCARAATSSSATSRSPAPPRRRYLRARRDRAARAGGARRPPPQPRCRGACRCSTSDPLDGARRRAQPRRRRGAGAVAARAARASARSRSCWACSRTRTPRAMLASAAAAVRARVVHRAAEPPRAVAGRAAVARPPARLRRGRLRAAAARALAQARDWARGTAGRRARHRLGLPRRRAARPAARRQRRCAIAAGGRSSR